MDEVGLAERIQYHAPQVSANACSGLAAVYAEARHPLEEALRKVRAVGGVVREPLPTFVDPEESWCRTTN